MPHVVQYERRAPIAIVMIDNPPVNALNQAIRRDLLDALVRARADAGIRALLLVGQGRLFSAGADVGEFGDATRPPPYLREVIRAFDASDKPIVAVIHGAALGGALELAMACHYRLSAPGAKLGLSEVKFGIIPGAGGTQLLPRLIGPAAALDMITTGESVDGREAAALGLVDLVIEGNLLSGALAFAREVADRRPLPRASQRRDRLAFTPGLFEAAEGQVGKRSRGASAPRLAVAAVRAAVDLPFERGLERERELWAQAAASSESAAMRYLFGAERAAAKLPDAQASTSAVRIERAAVIGAGTMGTGIAIALADAAIDVMVVGRQQDRVDAAMSKVHRHYAASLEKRKLSHADIQARLARVSATVRWDRLADVDLAIETIVEEMEPKRETLARLDAECRPDAILATNTSSLNLDAIATATRRPERMLGLHFFSPAHATKLVEIVRGERTALPAIETGIMLAKQLGKLAVVARAGNGIASTRMFGGYLREANLLLLEGALPHEIDAAMVGFGMALGPLATSDLAGLDVGRLIRKFETQPPLGARVADAIPDRLADMGRLGQKADCGYHRYQGGGRSPHRDPAVEALIVDISNSMGLTRRSVGASEIVERCVSAMVSEGTMLLHEGLVSRASDIDVIWVDAYGFPRHRGGPMYHAGQGGPAPRQ